MISTAAMIELESADAYVTVHPEQGARIGDLQVFGRPLLHTDTGRGPTLWGCFPMAPWAGRVRDGQFAFDDRQYQLQCNLAPHAIHGTTFDASWEVLDAGRDYCALQTPLNWPFGGMAHQHFHLHDAGLTCVLTVYARELMPAVIGWHPCFHTPDRADLQFGRMYRRDEFGITVPDLTEPAPHPWDDCFLDPQRPLRLEWPELTLELTSDCDHWVVFDGFTDMLCVEPQSGPPDAFTIGGATRLAPGDMLQRHLAFQWRPRNPQE